MARNKKKAKREKATVAFIDESGILMAPLVRRTWAPRRQTPILYQRTRSHKKISDIAALCSRINGRRVKLYFRFYENANFNTELCIAFIEQLKKNIHGRFFIVWDGLHAHRSKKMKQYLSKERQLKKRFRLFHFPPYAPELNPIEYAWGHLKMNALANDASYELHELNRKAKNGICEIRRERKLLRSFIKHSGIPFFN